MGTRSTAMILIGILTMSSSIYGWENLPPGNAVTGTPPPQTAGQSQSYSSPSQASSTPVTRQPPAGAQGNESTMGSDATGWPVYPYPDYHNPYYSGSSPRDLFSGAVDWLVGFPGTMVDRLSNFLDRKVFPQVPATHGAPSTTPNAVQPLYVNPEKPATLPPATPYIRDEAKGR